MGEVSPDLDKSTLPIHVLPLQRQRFETLVMDDESREDMEQYVCQGVEDKWIVSHAQRPARLRNQEVDRDF